MEKFVNGFDTEKAAKDREIAMLKARVAKLERSILVRDEIEEINDILNYEANNYGRLEEGVINLLKRYRTRLEEILQEV